MTEEKLPRSPDSRWPLLSWRWWTRVGLWCRLLLWSTVAFVACAGAVRLTVKDELPGLAVVFYAAPPMILAILTLLLAVLAVRRKRRVWTAASILAGIGFGLEWFVASFHSAPVSEIRVPHHKVMFWNVCRGYFGWEGVREEIRAWGPDVVALAELTGPAAAAWNAWQAAFPDYQLSHLQRGLMLMVRRSAGKITSQDHRGLLGGGPCLLVDVELGGTPYRLLVVDVKSNPLRRRNTQLAVLTETAELNADRRFVVIGDFNTPTDSVFFAPLRRVLHNAFERHGNGYSCTWPVLLPVLPLDQVWVNERVPVIDCQIGWSLRSDHRPLYLRLGS